MIAELLKQLLPTELQSIIYIGEFPTDIDNCISVTEKGGPHGTYFAKDQLNTPLVLIQVRDISYLNGYTNIELCKTTLTSFAEVQHLSIILSRDINYLGRDEKRRNIFQIIFKIYYTYKN